MAATKWLEQIKTLTQPRPTAALMYGPPGIGKTSLGAAIPGCVFLCDDEEDGITTLKSHQLIAEDIPQLPPARSWSDVLGMLSSLSQGDHGYTALVIDTIGGLERLCHEHVCQTQYGGDWSERGFLGYGRGVRTSLSEWRLLIRQLDNLRSRGMSVVLLAHRKQATIKNPEGPDYDRFLPDLDERTWSLTHKWVDLVLYLTYHIEVVTDKPGEPRGKGRGGHRRVMRTTWDAAFEAKNRAGLPEEIEMGTNGSAAWANLMAALKHENVRK